MDAWLKGSPTAHTVTQIQTLVQTLVLGLPLVLMLMLVASILALWGRQVEWAGQRSVLLSFLGLPRRPDPGSSREVGDGITHHHSLRDKRLGLLGKQV